MIPVPPSARTGGYPGGAVLLRLVVLTHHLLQELRRVSAGELAGRQVALGPDCRQRFVVGDVAVVVEVRVQETFVHAFERLGTEGRCRLGDQVRRDTVGRRSGLGLPNPKAAAIGIGRRAQPGLRVAAELLQRPTGIGPRAQQEAAPLDFDRVTFLLVRGDAGARPRCSTKVRDSRSRRSSAPCSSSTTLATRGGRFNQSSTCSNRSRRCIPTSAPRCRGPPPRRLPRYVPGPIRVRERSSNNPAVHPQSGAWLCPAALHSPQSPRS